MKRKLLTVLAAVMTVSMMLTACGTKDVSKMEDSELYAYLMEMDEDERDAFISGLEDNTDKYRAYQVLLIGQIGEAEVEDDFETTLNINDSDYYENKKENSNYDTSDIPSTEIVGELEATKEPTWSNGFEFERSDKWDSFEYGINETFQSEDITPSYAIQVGDLFITSDMTEEDLIALSADEEKYKYKSDNVSYVITEKATDLKLIINYYTKNDVTYITYFKEGGRGHFNFADIRILDGTTVLEILNMSEEDAKEYFESVAAKYGITAVEFEDEQGHGLALQVPGCDRELIKLHYNDSGRIALDSYWFYTGNFGK